MNSLILMLIPALIMVESGGRNLTGDGGKAVGVLQIHKEVLTDVNRIYGTRYTLKDREDTEKSKRICSLYLSYWGKHYEKTTGKKISVEVLAAIWNGGPNGYKKSATKNYIEKVMKIYGTDAQKKQKN